MHLKCIDLDMFNLKYYMYRLVKIYMHIHLLNYLSIRRIVLLKSQCAFASTSEYVKMQILIQ